MEAAAGREGVSTNTWIVRALRRGLDPASARHRQPYPGLRPQLEERSSWPSTRRSSVTSRPEPRDGSDGRPQGRPTGVRTVRRRPPPRAAGGARDPRCRVSTRRARSLKIGLGGGHVSVETDDVEETTVDVEALRDDEVTREAIAAMRIEARDRGGFHEVVVEAPKRSRGWLGALGRGPKIGIRVRCPHDADLRVNTSSADIEADGRLGDVEVNTASGDVSLERHLLAQGEQCERDVSVREIGASGAIKTASGDVRVQRAHGTLSANLVSGDFELGRRSRTSRSRRSPATRRSRAARRRAREGAVGLGASASASRPG